MLGVPIIDFESEDNIHFHVSILESYMKDYLNMESYPDFYSDYLYNKVKDGRDNVDFALHQLDLINRMSKIVDNLLEYYKIDVYQLPFNYTPSRSEVLKSNENTDVRDKIILIKLRNELTKIKSYLDSKLLVLPKRSSGKTVQCFDFKNLFNNNGEKIEYAILSEWFGENKHKVKPIQWNEFLSYCYHIGILKDIGNVDLMRAINDRFDQDLKKNNMTTFSDYKKNRRELNTKDYDFTFLDKFAE